MIFSEMKKHHPPLLCFPTGCIARTVSSPNQHLLRTDDVISCCLDLSAPSISFRINGQPVQGMFENFNIDGLFFPVVSFSAGIKLVSLFFGLFAFSFLVLSQKTLYCHHTCFTNLLSWASVYRAFCPVAKCSLKQQATCSLKVGDKINSRGESQEAECFVHISSRLDNSV